MAALLLLAFLVAQTLLASRGQELADHPFETVLELVCIAVAGTLLVASQRLRTPLAVCVAIVAAVVLATLLMTVTSPLGSWPAQPRWQLDASTVLLCLLVLRGRAGTAWIGMGLVSLVTVLFSVAGARPIASGVILYRPLAVLLLCSIFVFVLTRVLRWSHGAHLRQQASRAGLLAREAASLHRRQAADELEARAGRLLELIARGEPLSEVERRECLLLEGTLRDEVRAPRLTAEPLSSAVRVARASAADVLLLDDGADLPDAGDVAFVVEWMSTIVLRGRGTEMVARILPPGRELVATVVITNDGESDAHRLTWQELPSMLHRTESEQ